MSYTTHGHRPKGRASPTYSSWRKMKDRCLNPNHMHYATYGGAGITIDPRWHDFSAFLADMGERPAGKTLDRKDGTLGYCKDNCRWATPTEQNRNMKSNVHLTFEGRTQCISAWTEELGWARHTIRNRLRLGWTVTVALSTPVNVAQTLTINGVTQTVAEWAREHGVGVDRIYSALKQGADVGAVLARRPRAPARTLTINGKTEKIAYWSQRHGVKLTTILGRLDRGWPPEDAIKTNPLSPKRRLPRAT